MTVTRRSFLAASAVAGAAFAAPAVHGADKNHRYRTALVGSGWWGMNILRTAIEAGRSNVVAMCDVDTNQLDPAVAEVENKTGAAPKKYKDYRELLEKEKPEIVIVGTPDHWHPLCTIAAVNAGAHVYVEKPISHTIAEGRAMVQAARANDRVVQVGTHRRASPHCISAQKFMKEGKLGKIGMVRAFVLYAGGPGTPEPDSDPPPGLDWDMWCGPGPLRPFNKRIHPKGFRAFLDYANGTLGDWGIHWMDQILWWSEEQQYPKSVHSTGGRHIKEDNTDAPDAQVVNYEFDDFTVVWEHRQFGGNGAEKHNVGCYFYGTEGMLHLGWLDGWTFYPTGRSREPIHEEAQLHLPDQQNIPELWENFLACIESGQKPVSDIEFGHRSTTMSLLGMLSLKLGRSVRWDGEKEVIPGDDEANRLLRREYRQPWQYPQV
ncbi:MAG: Gfo/Idh/MocA family oxidoreductase [Bryobacterales bacterium]|nr:Gfo/Idh/MocA family oxidoreductase [Bryobacterales bacterium]